MVALLNCRRWGLGAGVAAGIAVAVWGNWGPNGLMRTILPLTAAWRHGGGHPFTWIDRVFADPGLQGNTYLVLAGFDPQRRPDHEDVVQRVYFRGVYDLYPERELGVVPEPVPINHGRDISLTAAPPPPEVLRQFGYRQVLLFQNPESGPITVRVFPLRDPPRLPTAE